MTTPMTAERAALLRDLQAAGGVLMFYNLPPDFWRHLILAHVTSHRAADGVTKVWLTPAGRAAVAAERAS